MADIVVTCPKDFWREWIAEGDAAGAPWSGESWGWYMGGRRPDIEPGDRLYVVAWGRLRGFAPVTALRGLSFDPAHGSAGGMGAWVDWPFTVAQPGWFDNQWCICRNGDAEAVTIDQAIPGFRGWRRRWWEREDEIPFPQWQTEGVAA